MKELLGSIAQVSDIVQAISVASAEQGSGIEQVSRSTSQMDQVTQQNAAQVEQLAAASSLLNDRSTELRDSVTLFRL